MTAVGDGIDRRHIPGDLYGLIKRIMPIVCVDLVVVDAEDRLLLVKRSNPPAQGEWWFPGGRVHFGETRIEAARRKLREECGLTAHDLRELFTADCILHEVAGDSHAVTTFFMAVTAHPEVRLDYQSREYSWKSRGEWKSLLPGNIVWSYICRAFSVADTAA